MNLETLDITQSTDSADDTQESMSSDPPTPTTDDVVAGLAALSTEVQTAIDGMVHDIDMPGIWTERQKGVYRSTRTVLYQHLSHCGVVIATIQKASADLTWLRPARDRLPPVLREIEKQIAEMPDVNRIADFHEQKREWERQVGLASSFKVLTGRMGVNYFGGLPALPSPLKELMSEFCTFAGCPHGRTPYIHWSGALPALDEKIAEAEKAIADNIGQLPPLRAEVAPLLVQATAAMVTASS